MSSEEKLFDQLLAELYQDTTHKAFLKAPELRSVLVMFDYSGNLNNEDGVAHGLWVTRDEEKGKSVVSTIGSLGVLLQTSSHLFDLLVQKHAELTGAITQISKEIAEKIQESDGNAKSE
jgi:hypothetical protein